MDKARLAQVVGVTLEKFLNALHLLCIKVHQVVAQISIRSIFGKGIDVEVLDAAIRFIQDALVLFFLD